MFTTAGGDLIVDVIGTYTSAAAPDSTDGLFVPLATPTRFFDTRGALNPLGPAKRLLPQWAVEVPALTNPAINRPDISALDMNVTINETISAGYFSVTTAGSSAPGPTRSTSTLNATHPAQTLANHAIVPVSARGFEVFSEKGGQVIADVSGYYLGVPAGRRRSRRRRTSIRRPRAASASPAARRHDRHRCVTDGDRPGAAAADRPRVLGPGRRRRLRPDHLAGRDGVPEVEGPPAARAATWTRRRPTRSNTTLCRPTAGRSGDYFEVDRAKQIAHGRARRQGAVGLQRVDRQRQELRRGRPEERRPSRHRRRDHAARRLQDVSRARRRRATKATWAACTGPSSSSAASPCTARRTCRTTRRRTAASG